MLPSIQTTLLLAIEKQNTVYTQSYLHDWKHFDTYYNTDDTQKLQEGLRTLLAHHHLNPLYLDEHALLFSTASMPSTLLPRLTQRSLLIRCQYQELSHCLPLLFSWFTVLAAFQANHIPLPITITWLISDQTSTAAISALIATHATALQADACLYYTLDHSNIYTGSTSAPLLICGTKGLLSTQLTLQSAPAPISAIHGSVVPDAAWRLIWALHALKDAREEILIDGFYDTLVPLEDEAVDLLHKLSQNCAELARSWGLSQPLLGLQGFQFHYAHLLTPSCTVRSISAGTTGTSLTAPMIPHQAQAEVDFYLLPGQDPSDIFAGLQHHLISQGFPDIQTNLLSASPPTYTSVSHPFVQQIYQATTLAYGTPPTIFPIAPDTIPIAPLHQQIPTVIIADPAPIGIDTTPLNEIAHARQLILLITMMDA